MEQRMINQPKTHLPYPERKQDCQAALSSTFDRVLLMAEQFGWTRTEAAQALQELAYTQLALIEDQRLCTLSPEQQSYVRH